MSILTANSTLQFIWTLKFKQMAMHKVFQIECPNARLPGSEFKLSLQSQAMIEKIIQFCAKER